MIRGGGGGEVFCTVKTVHRESIGWGRGESPGFYLREGGDQCPTPPPPPPSPHQSEGGRDQFPPHPPHQEDSYALGKVKELSQLESGH